MTAKKSGMLNCLCPPQMLKQCLVSQHNTNYIKNYFLYGLLFQNHFLKFHDFFSTYVLMQDFSGSEKSKDEFRDFS